MPDLELVTISRLQFAATAMYHFLFVPLTLGLSWILFIMESVYVMTGKPIYKDMTKFWGTLFGINFVMGVTTGLTMEFQFGTNWAYYSHYVGDVFGVPLAIEGLMAFFLESTMVGLFFFGWDRLSKVGHLIVTFLVAVGTNLSALWILVANGWMQNPVGADFNYTTMRMELTSLADVFFNPIAQVKFVHTVAAGYTTGSMFVLGISAWYLLKRRDVAFALRSFAVASGFGLASVISVLVLGDESGYTTGEVQKVKLAVMEAEWETHEPPAPFTLAAWPNQAEQRNEWAIKVPWLMGIIATRSLDEEVLGIKDLTKAAEARINSGIVAYGALEKLRAGDNSPEIVREFDKRRDDLGHGLLLRRYTPNVVDATPEQIRQAANDTIPQVAPMFWMFRVMVGCGLLMLFTFATSFYFCARRTVIHKTWLLQLALYAIPLPWIAAEAGWFVAEFGRQPWSIAGVLPTFLAVSQLEAGTVYASLAAFVLFYSALLVVEMYLMFKYARLGPSSLGTGRYYFETGAGGGSPAGLKPLPAARAN